MGNRSQNILAIKDGHELSFEVKKYLSSALVAKDKNGTLYSWETNITPMWARDEKGEHCVNDLLEEVAIHQFLSALPRSDFYLLRVGDDSGVRGTWDSHSFRHDPRVVEIESDLRSLTNDPTSSHCITSRPKG
jgi:hypothetical protein